MKRITTVSFILAVLLAFGIHSRSEEYKIMSPQLLASAEKEKNTLEKEKHYVPDEKGRTSLKEEESGNSLLLDCLTCPSYDFFITPASAYQTHTSSIVSNGCRIYILYVSQGNTYTFKTGCGDGASAAFDTFLELYDGSCVYLTGNDDGCAPTQSIITWVATYSGYAFVKVRGYNSSYYGSYTLAYNAWFICKPCPEYDFTITPAASFQTHSSSIVSNGCKIYRFSCTMGNTYTFKTGCGDGATAAFDTYLELSNSSCSVITFNDDGCESARSLISWTADYTGTADIQVRGYNSTHYGNYTLAYKVVVPVICLTCPSYDFSISPAATFLTHSSSIVGNGCRIYSFNVTTGYEYTFKTGCGDGATATFDTYIELNNGSCSQLAYSDDGCENATSQLIWTANYTGAAFLKVRGYSAAYYGAYTLAFKGVSPVTCLTCPNYDFNITPFPTFQTHTSSIVSNGCKIYMMNVTSGYEYTFKTGCGDGATAGFDTYFELYDGSCTYILGVDDGCENFTSYLNWTATFTGPAFLKVRGLNSSNFGTFVLAYKAFLPVICLTCPSYDFTIAPTENFQTHSSSIVSNGCKIYSVPVTQGYEYTFKTGCGDGATAAFDTYLALYNNSCLLLMEPEDNCENYTEIIIYTATYSGTAFLKVRGFGSNNYGYFTLAYKATPPIICQECPGYDFSVTPTETFQTHSSSIESEGCKIYSFYAMAGYTYTFKTGCGDGASCEFDSFLELYWDCNTQIMTDDDGCAPTQSIITWTACQDGYVFLKLSGFSYLNYGNYTLAFTRKGITVICPNPIILPGCNSQEIVNEEFYLWISLFEFSGGCNTTATDLSVFTPPDACGGRVDVTYSATDKSGQNESCTSYFEAAPPAVVAICQEWTLMLPDETPTAINPNWINGGSYGGCGSLTLSVPPDFYDCTFAPYNVGVELTVTDSCGNSSSCIADVYFDTYFPSIGCPADVLKCIPPTQSSTTLSNIDPTIGSGCNYNIRYEQCYGGGGGTGSASNVLEFWPGVEVVTYFIETLYYGSSDCSFYVYVEQIENPNAGNNQYLCNQATTTLNGTPPVIPPLVTLQNVNWSYLPPSIPTGAPDPVIDPPQGSSIVNVSFNTTTPPLMDYTYTFVYGVLLSEGNATCLLSDTVTITNFRPPFPPDAGTDQEIIFAGSSVSTAMNATPVSYGQGNWSAVSHPAGFPAFIENIIDPFTQVIFYAPGIYEFDWITNHGANCNPLSDRMTVNVGSLEVIPSQVSVGPGFGMTYFTVASTVSWSVTETVPWFSAFPLSGSGNGTINVEYSENTLLTPRSGQISISAAGLPNVIVTVNQAGALPIFTVTPPNRDVTAPAGTTTFSVTSNTAWTVAENVVWFSVLPMSGGGNGSLTVDYTQNTLATPRSGQITVSASGIPDVVVTVNQAGATPALSVTPSSRDVSAAAGTTTFSVTSNTSWTVAENVAWFSVLPMSGNGNGTLTVDYTQNTLATPRSGQITVSASGVPDVVVAVNQAGADLNKTLVLKAYLEGPFNGTTMNTTINSVLPLTHPFNPSLPYFGNALPDWYYNGTGSVGVIPNTSIVDWVLVELRDAVSAANATRATMFAQLPAFILSNGSIVALDGVSNLQFSYAVANNLFVVIYNRNHESIMNANLIPLSSGTYTYDFTTGASQVFGGTSGHKELSPGKWGMRSGDGNADGDATITDKTNVWGIPGQTGKTGYLPSDYNFDTQTNNKDKNEKWKPNLGTGSQVPN
jgi:hypothetical protein